MVTLGEVQGPLLKPHTETGKKKPYGKTQNTRGVNVVTKYRVKLKKNTLANSWPLANAYLRITKNFIS